MSGISELLIRQMDPTNSGLINLSNYMPWKKVPDANNIYMGTKWKNLNMVHADIQSMTTSQTNLEVNKLLWYFYHQPGDPVHLVKYETHFHIIDGHHRLAIALLSGKNKFWGYAVNAK